MAPRSSTPITRRCPMARSASPQSFEGKAVSKTQLQRQRSESPRPVSERSDDSPGAFIRVVARVRPKLAHEAHAAGGVEVDVASNSLTLTNSSDKGKKFYVDEVFDSRQEQGSQDAIFSGFAMNYVNHSLSGYNVCLFAYGHTGSGKTYTMLGDQNCDATGIGSQAGMMPRFLHELFSAHSCDAEQHVRRYSCEFYEVYNEQIKDLLVPVKSGERTRKVHVHPKHGVRVENLTMSVVSSAEETLQLVDFGTKMRAVAATTMNARSSRSHAVFTFKYEQDTCDAQSRRSMVTFVDLAGREDLGASQNGARHMREMCCINTSLFHLATVITKLSQGSINGRSLADFRNSKLTLLLSPALIGNSKTALIATVAPLQDLYDDSLCTMNFAASVKKIKTQPVINNKAPNRMVSDLEAEVRQLQSELNIAKTRDADQECALLSAKALVSFYKTSCEEALQKSKQSDITRKKSLKSLQIRSPGSAESLSTSLSSADSMSTGVSSPPIGSPMTFDMLQSPDVTMNASSPEITSWLSQCLQLQQVVSGKSSVCSSRRSSGSMTPTDCTDYHDRVYQTHRLSDYHRPKPRPSPSSGDTSPSSASPATTEEIPQEVSHELRRNMSLVTEVFRLQLDDLKHCSLDAEQCSTHTSPTVSTFSEERSTHTSPTVSESSEDQIVYRPKPYAASAGRSSEDPVVYCPKPSAPSAGRSSEDPIACRPVPSTPTLCTDASLEHFRQSGDLAMPMPPAAIGNAYRSSRRSLTPATCISAATAPPKCFAPKTRRHSIGGPLESTTRTPSPAPCRAALVTTKHSNGFSQACDKDFSTRPCSPSRSSPSPARRFVGPFPKLTWAYYEVPESF